MVYTEAWYEYMALDTVQFRNKAIKLAGMMI